MTERMFAAMSIYVPSKVFVCAVFGLLFADRLMASEEALNEALHYYDSPGREQAKAAQLLAAAIPTVKDEHILLKLYLNEARLFSQSYDHDKEKPDYLKSIECYKRAISLKSVAYSLNALEARVELVDLLTFYGRYAEAKPLMLEVINADFDKICQDQITSHDLSSLAAYDFRESFSGPPSPASHAKRVALTMKQARKNVMESYLSIRGSAFQSLCIIAHRETGIAGVRNLRENYVKDAQATPIIDEEIAKYQQHEVK